MLNQFRIITTFAGFVSAQYILPREAPISKEKFAEIFAIPILVLGLEQLLSKISKERGAQLGVEIAHSFLKAFGVGAAAGYMLSTLYLLSAWQETPGNGHLEPLVSSLGVASAGLVLGGLRATKKRNERRERTETIGLPVQSAASPQASVSSEQPDVYSTGSPYRELYDRVNKTHKCRFNAHQRMNLLHRANQWTITLLSLALLVVPLARGFGLTLAVSVATSDVVQAMLAIAVLTISLRMDASNHQLRAEKHLQCGKTLAGLLIDLEPHRSQEIDSEYKSFAVRYHAILDGYENHEPVDYQFMKLNNSAYETNWQHRWHARFSYAVGFIVPVILICGVLGWLMIAIFGYRTLTQHALGSTAAWLPEPFIQPSTISNFIRRTR